MIQPKHEVSLLPLVLLSLCALFSAAQPAGDRSFTNFETAPVHPLALNSSATLLAACNLPDNRVEIFDLTSGNPAFRRSIFTGLDPVSARFRTDSELWVVNHLSDSITVVDLTEMKVLANIAVGDAPADVVFAGPDQHAFVSCSGENLVMVIDPLSGEVLERIAVEGDRPKALAVSPDGAKVYVAIFESGNASTIIAPRMSLLDHAAPSGPVDLPFGPPWGRKSSSEQRQRDCSWIRERVAS